MKILIINSVCNKGSTGVICYNLHNYAKNQGHTSLFCYGRGQMNKGSDTLRIISKIEFLLHVFFARMSGLQGYFSVLATKKICKIINNYNPDVVYLGNLHGYYISEFKLINYIKSKAIKTVYLMFDEYPYMGKCAYSGDCDKYMKECCDCPKVKEYPRSWFFDKSRKIFWDKYQAYKGFKNLVFTSVPYNIAKARNSFLLKDKNLLELGWGIDVKNTFIPKDTKSLRDKLHVPEDVKIVLNVAPYNDDRKGVKRFFVEIAKTLIEERIVFINVGFNGKKEECPSNFIGVGFISNQKELSEYFSLADLLLITSINDTYPTVALDSIACGTPVCGFNVSGMPYIAPAPICTCKEEINDLTLYVKEHPQKTESLVSACRNYALENFDENIMNQRLLKLNDILA